jgi:hypothetical protein
MDFTLLDLETVLRQYGRGTVWYAVDGLGEPTRWDGTSELNLAHLGDTEGDIVFSANNSVATLTLPEISGGAIHDAIDTGESPTLEFPLFLADPDLLPIVAPRGSASAGHIRVCDVAERTIVVFPEKLFKVGTDPCTYGTLAYTLATGWTLNTVALTAAQQTLLELSLWLWRGYFTRPNTTFKGGHGDDGKNIEPVTFNPMMHPGMPDGHRLYTRGDPATAGILIEGTS